MDSNSIWSVLVELIIDAEADLHVAATVSYYGHNNTGL
jgi:hypothetical protein